MLALLTVPIPLGIALVAEDVVPLFLGSQWQPTVVLLQPLCVAVAVSALGTNSQLAYVALNRAHLTAVAALVRLLLLLALLLSVPALYGAVGVAYAVAVAGFVMLIADYALSSRILRIRAGSLLRAVWRPVTASLVMCFVVWLMRSRFAPGTDISTHLLSLTRSALVGVAVYIVCEMALWIVAGRPGGAEARLVALLASYADRRRRKAA
jgi:PST family polysaccharide transporter